MRFHLLVAALCGLALLAAANGEQAKKTAKADDKKVDDKKVSARELDLKGLKLDMPRGDVTKPTRIAKADELEKTVADKEAREKLAKQVDFAKEHLLLFAWSGSGGDKLTSNVTDEKGKAVVVFTYTAGHTDDVKAHTHLYAIPREAMWRVEKK